MTGRAVRAACTDLPGWPGPGFAEAMAAYRRTAKIPASDDPADVATTFRPAIENRAEGVLTGYYEPELSGSRRPTNRLRAALYAPPRGLTADRPWLTRAEIEASGRLAGREIVWVEDALEAFLAQVQGSVRVRLPDGAVLRLGFAARNGHPYRSIGAELVARGAIAADAISVPAIRDWCARHPGEVPALLRSNPSFVFFRELSLAPDDGPIGAARVPLTAGHSIAVDPDCIPLGTALWVEAGDAPGFPRLMVAQDTGSAIKGPGRGDVFFGSGPEAGALAGTFHRAGRLTPLAPVAGGA